MPKYLYIIAAIVSFSCMFLASRYSQVNRDLGNQKMATIGYWIAVGGLAVGMWCLYTATKL